MRLWDILVCGVAERLPESAERLAKLYAQAKGRDVNIIVLIDDAQVPLHEKRNALLEMSDAEYVSFVDDDDEVADDFVTEITSKLDGVDYVGFQVRHFDRGKPSKPVYHSLRYPKWSEDERGFYRNISHLNPIRSEIAKQFKFDREFGEDADWAKRVYESGLVKTENFINKPMYFYYADADKSVAWRKRREQREA